MFSLRHVILGRLFFDVRQISITKRTIKTGIVMINMGGPEKIDQVEGYLQRVLTDSDLVQFPFAQKRFGMWIAKRRTPEVIKKYEEIGGGSPILKWTKLQGKLLCDNLDKLSPDTAPHKPYVAFRYASPYTDNALEELEKDGVEHAILFSQYPQYCCATTGSSFNEIYRYFERKGVPSGMKLSVIDRWSTDSYLARCFADNIIKELDTIPKIKKKDVIILFSAHSIPLKAVNRGDPYPSEVGATVHQVMGELSFKYAYRIVWQSKVGPIPWLGPMTDEAIKDYVKQGKKTFVVVPIAFVNEHIETLHELDIEYCKDLAKDVGVDVIRRVPAPNDHPMFIEGITNIVLNHLNTNTLASPKFLKRCPHCINESCLKTKRWFAEVCQA